MAEEQKGLAEGHRVIGPAGGEGKQKERHSGDVSLGVHPTLPDTDGKTSHLCVNSYGNTIVSNVALSHNCQSVLVEQLSENFKATNTTYYKTVRATG